MSAHFVYGLVRSGTELPDGLTGLAPLRMIAHRDVAAVVSEVPDRAVGTRADLVAHESVVDALAAAETVLPMRFPAVIEEAGVVEELLAPHHDQFLAALDRLEGTQQFTVRGTFVEEAALRAILAEDAGLRALIERIRAGEAPQEERVALGEAVVAALRQRGEAALGTVVDRLSPLAVSAVVTPAAQPDDIGTAAFLVAQDRVAEFDDAVERLGADTHEWLRLRLLGPLAPYDFVAEPVIA